MRMKNPVHPGALAKANLEELGLSVSHANSFTTCYRLGARSVRRWHCDLKGVRWQRGDVAADAGSL